MDGPGLASLAEAVCGDGDPVAVRAALRAEPRLPDDIPLLIEGVLKECGLQPRRAKIVGEDDGSKESKQRRKRAAEAARRRGGVDAHAEAMRLLG